MNRRQKEQERLRKRKMRENSNPPEICHSASQVMAINPYRFSEMIGDSHTEITDDVVQIAINLMKASFDESTGPYIAYYTPAQIHLYTNLKSHIAFIPVNRPSINIHPLSGHWVTSFYNTDRNKVYVYDSLMSLTHLNEVRNQLCCMYGKEILKSVCYVKVTQQCLEPICGVMAIAFAYTCLTGGDPTSVNYDISCVRSHLKKCFQEGQLLPFPTVREFNSETNVCMENSNKEPDIIPWIKSYLKDQEAKSKNMQTSAEKSFIIDKSYIQHQQKIRKQRSRSNRSPQTFKIQQISDKVRKKRARSERSPETVKIHQISDSNRKKRARSELSPSAIEMYKTIDKTNRKRARSERSPEAVKIHQISDSNRKKRARSELSPSAVEMYKTIDKTNRKRARSERSPETVKIHQISDSNRKKRIRSERSPETVKIHQISDSNRKKRTRSERCPDIVKANKTIDKSRKKRARSELSPSAIEMYKTIDKTNRKRARSELSPSAIEMYKTIDKTNRKRARSERSPETVKIHQISDSNRKKRARSELSPSAIEMYKTIDKTNRKRARSEQSPETVKIHQISDSNRKKRARSELSPSAIEMYKTTDKTNRKRARSERSPETVKIHQISDSNRKKRARSELSPSAIEMYKTTDKTNRKRARSEQSPETSHKQRNTDKTRKKAARLKQCEKQESIEVAIENFRQCIKQGPTFICCCCWRLLYRRSVIHVNKEKYTKFNQKKLNNILTTDTSNDIQMICKTCDKKLKYGMMPSQAQANKMTLVDRPNTLLNLSSLENQLICKIIPFMKIIAMPRGAQHGVRGQVVLVPADLSKVTKNLPRASSEESQIITLALKRRLADKSYVQKQYIRPHVVNSALNYLKRNNKCYRDVTIRSDWVETCEAESPDFFRAAIEIENLPQTGADENICDIVDIDIEAKNADYAENEKTTESGKGNIITDILDSEDEVELDNPQDFITDLNNSRQVNADTCIHPINGTEVHTNEILNLAPAEGQAPVSVSKEPYWEGMAFPTLFPTAENTYHVDERRPVKISLKQYFNARLLCKDSRFAESPEYAFAALDILERESVKQNIAITSRKSFYQDINVGELKNPHKLQKLLTENQLFATFKNIRGTPQYFQQMHLDMLAKLRQYGPYTFFISASAAEFHWPEVIQIVGKQYGQSFTEEQVNGMDWQTKRSWLQRNPVTVARHIDYIFEQLWGKVILSGAHPVGQVLNFDIRKEMQGRGTAHFHSALHVQNAPKLDVDPDESFTSFADKYIKCTLPDEDSEIFSLVNTRQRHHHTRTCKKNVCVICRFGFPRPPSNKTVIARVPDNSDDKRVASTLLTKVYKAVAGITTDNIPSMEQLLKQVNVSPDQYEWALKVAHRRTHIVMKRSPADVNINNYNPVLLKCLRSNMDIQMITSIWACIAYITSYICKPEKTMSEMMRKASKEAQDKNITDRLYHISNQLRKGREVSHHESIMRTLSIPLRRSNVAVIFIPTGKQEDRTRILKPKAILDSLEDSDTDIYMPSIHDKYAARPDALNDECLAGFVAKFSTLYPKTSEGSSEEAPECEKETDDNSTKEYIQLKDNMGKLYRRRTPQIIRYHYISKEKDEEEYYHRLLILYLPWKSEQELKCNGGYKEKFEEVKETIIPIIKQYEPYYDEVEHIIDTFDPDEMLPEVWDQVSANIQQDIANEYNVRCINSHLDPELIEKQPVDHSKKMNSNKTFTLTPTYQMADQDFHKFVQTLNEKQKYLFDFMFNWATETRLLEDKPPPFYIFLSGSGGVGKSHLVNTIYQGVTRALKTPGQNPDQPTVLLTASTGKAATGINGTTLHSAFALPVKTKASKSSEYKKTGSERLNKMRSSYANLKLIIADEISMFGSQNLQNLHLALQDIFQDYNTPFAGVAILAVGDLLQLNPVGDTPVFKPSTGGYEALAGSLWTRHFQLHELTDIVRQKGDPEFAAILSRVRTGDFTDEDIVNLQKLQNTSTDSFPHDTVNMFLTNDQAGKYNNQMIEDLPGKVTIHAIDSKRDKHTNTVSVQITTSQIYSTGGLPSTLTIAVGATVMITKNIDLPDRLVNGVVGKVEFINIDEQKPLKGTVFLKFSDPSIGRENKKRSPQHLKDCVPIQAITVSFLLTSECPVPVERTMYPLVLAFGLTAHKSQGSTYKHCIANLELPPNMKSVMQGHAYTMLSRATSRDGLKLVSFSADKIKVNKSALVEMDRLREHCTFSWKHPFENLDPIASMHIGFLNIRSLKAHLSDLAAERDISRLNALCLTETHITEECSLEGFCGYFKPTQHGLAMFTKGESTDFECNSSLQFMSRIVSYQGRNFLIAVNYRPPQFNKYVYFTLFSSAVNAIPKSYNIILGGDFNLMPDDPVVIKFCQEHQLRQYVEKPTHQLGRTLDLIFASDTIQCSTSTVIPVSYTDHFLTILSVF